MNKTTTIRVNRDIYNSIKLLAQKQNENMQDIIEKAINDYKKKKFFDELNTAYVKLMADPKAWEEEVKEREEWDAVLADGWEDDDEG
ncbi:MAG: CopG family transcriptional regulator [Clostridia bacterium]|nr:CopG family transcriptional regulator [Clostridia bacterium]